MSGVTQAHRDEAARLLSLDERGREVEFVAFMLAQDEASKRAAEELAEMDRRFLDEYARIGREHGEWAGDGPIG